MNKIWRNLQKYQDLAVVARNGGHRRLRVELDSGVSACQDKKKKKIVVRGCMLDVAVLCHWPLCAKWSLFCYDGVLRPHCEKKLRLQDKDINIILEE